MLSMLRKSKPLDVGVCSTLLKACRRYQLKVSENKWNVYPMRHNLVRSYYKRPETKKRGPSIRGWMIFAGATISVGVLGIMYSGAPSEIPEENVGNYDHENIILAYLYRTKDRIKGSIKYFSDPISPKLLPDPLTEPYYQPPYTLVLELTDILVHPEYDRATGWRFRKRPGVDALLKQCAPPLFEIVIFTCEGGISSMPVIDKLDQEGCIMYRLFRDSTLYKNGHHIKDMSALNRDLSKVIVVDWDRNATQLNESNAVHLKRWNGDPSDRTLFDLIPFLRTIATSGVSDVRTVLDFYRQQGDDMLEAFKANQVRFLEEEERRAKLQKQSSGVGNSRWSSGGFAGKLFGSRAGSEVKQEDYDTEGQTTLSVPAPAIPAPAVVEKGDSTPSSESSSGSWWSGWFGSSSSNEESK